MEGRRSVGQYSLFGTLLNSAHKKLNGTSTQPQQENRLFLNTNIPTSFFICGLQGSGKSHTLSCLLENYLIPSNLLGVLRSPLSALVLHYDPFSTKQAFRPCEAVFLAGIDPTFPTEPSIRSVTVLVSPSNYHNMCIAYGQIPHVAVRALRLRPRDLTCGSMQALMSIDQSHAVPLYMSQVVRILRTMSAESAVFDYRDFKRRLHGQGFKGPQKEMLEQRLSLLESFLNLDHEELQEPLLEDAPGALTIVDLSCPFVNQDMACLLFNICVELYLSSPKATGKVIAVDEAHKYMADTPGARVLTQQLLAIIRLQRHCNTRVVVATQEPTISPLLIGLTSVKIIHHFSSVDWYQALNKHLPQRNEGDPGSDHAETHKRTHFDQIAQLERGEAVVFDPSAILGGINIDFSTVPTYTGASIYDKCFVAKIRKRVTLDGGRSIVCVGEDG
ncbi:hypothetical protein L211DRAFT_859630 [Terfezia boudieri ATCC MYA-4762]|uniref:Zona occludens toxin N-terminal domain-containing protein n=1 Tax=Terfezia boudieri ATCC MYA-4762 TaxID=1051890 RepID=A0A3N4M3R5_9PEZI|nr:hypothetical protein L211DRAFT_859630 [Terfezia boudieri ATCC MYA-4762]